MSTEPLATRDWHTTAIVRVLQETVCHSVDPWAERTFRAGEELEMVQWGRAGRPIDRDAWWTSYDIDGAFIIKANLIEVVKVLDEVAPLESEPEDEAMHKVEEYNRAIDERNNINLANREKPWLPLHDGE